MNAHLLRRLAHMLRRLQACLSQAMSEWLCSPVLASCLDAASLFLLSVSPSLHLPCSPVTRSWSLPKLSLPSWRRCDTADTARRVPYAHWRRRANNWPGNAPSHFHLLSDELGGSLSQLYV